MIALAACLAIFAGLASAAPREILLIAGSASHTPLMHEQKADALRLAGFLNQVPGIHATVGQSGWPIDDPTDKRLVAKADAIWISCDGGALHLIAQSDHQAQIRAAVDRGVGLMFFHYATEPPPGALHQEFLDWVGGFFERNYSKLDEFEANFASLPAHPITRGVSPFKLKDEWYYNIRFRADGRGITNILVATPPNEPQLGNQPVMWAYERPDGGRAVGFTGGHFHVNMGDDNVRKLILNALVWVAKGEIPADGVQSRVTPEDLARNLDPKWLPKFFALHRLPTLERVILLVLNGFLWILWVRNLFHPSHGPAPARRISRQAASIVICLALMTTVIAWAAPPGHRGAYELLPYALLAGLWLGAAIRLFPFFGASLRNDALKRNPGVWWIVNGALAGIAFCFAGANVGNGPGPEAVVFCAALASAAFFLLWFLVNLATSHRSGVGAIDRDYGGGIRLGGLLLGAGIAFGSAATGDWASFGVAVKNFLVHSWPVLPVLGVAILADRRLRRAPTVSGS